MYPARLSMINVPNQGKFNPASFRPFKHIQNPRRPVVGTVAGNRFLSSSS